MPRPKPTPTRKASGENIEEWQRGTERIVLRVPRAFAEAVRARAAEEEMTAAAYALRLLRQDMQIV